MSQTAAIQPESPNPYAVGPYEDCPWLFDFYFNGVLMPKWSRCWPTAFLDRFTKPQEEWDNAIGDRDLYLIEIKIDHVGVIESAPAAIFLFALQRVLLLSLAHQEFAVEVTKNFGNGSDPNEVWNGLVEGAFQMRDLVTRDRLAIWTSGKEFDQVRLQGIVEKHRAKPQIELLPHQMDLSRAARSKIRGQVRALHRIAHSGEFSKEIRSQLHQLQMPEEGFFQFVT